MTGPLVRQDASLAQLEDEVPAAGLAIELQRHRPDRRVLITEGESRFTLVGGDEVEIGEVQDIPPAVRHLAVGDLQPARRNLPDDVGNRFAIEDPMAKVAEDDDVGPL